MNDCHRKIYDRQAALARREISAENKNKPWSSRSSALVIWRKKKPAVESIILSCDYIRISPRLNINIGLEPYCLAAQAVQTEVRHITEIDRMSSFKY